MKAILLVVAAAAVAAILFLPQLLTPGIALGELNTRAYTDGAVADGYTDIELQGLFTVQATDQAVPDFTFQQVYFKETLGKASGPVTTIAPPATLDTDCKGQAEITVSEIDAPGHHINLVFAKSEERTFSLSDDKTTFKFGHLWLFDGATYRVYLDIFVWDCLGAAEKSLVKWKYDAPHEFSFKFNGVSEGIDGAGHRF